MESGCRSLYPGHMDQDELRKLAKTRLKAKAEFKNFLWIWLGVSGLLVVIWAISGYGTYFWPAWPIAGMGIAAFFIGLSAYGPTNRLITESDIDAEVAKLTKKTDPTA